MGLSVQFEGFSVFFFIKTRLFLEWEMLKMEPSSHFKGSVI